MTTKTYDEIANEIKVFSETIDMDSSHWTVGITDLSSKIFSIRQVDRDIDAWIYRTADNSEMAKHIKEVLLSKGFLDDKNSEKQVDECRIVFAYRKTNYEGNK